MKDIFQYRRRSLKNVVIPVSERSKSLVRQNAFANSIFVRRSVLTSVDLYDEVPIKTDEIEDVILERSLQSKFEPLQSSTSQQPPHGFLGLGG